MSNRTNHFELKGENKIEITYDVANILGQPLLHLKDAHRDVNFSGNLVHQFDTEGDHQVTVVLDKHGTELTVLIPFMNDEEKPIPFSSYAITTSLHRDPNGRDVRSYRVDKLKGTAEFVRA